MNQYIALTCMMLMVPVLTIGGMEENCASISQTVQLGCPVETTKPECPVCLEDLYQKGHDVITLGCNNEKALGKHTFHFACLYKSQEKLKDHTRAGCPLCNDLISIAQEPEYRVFAMINLMSDKQDPEKTLGCFADGLYLFKFFASCCSHQPHPHHN
jgi:hypothetical protein